MSNLIEASEIRFTLNHQAKSAIGVSPRQTLLEYIRQLGLTGAKEGCAEGECGACAVLVVKNGVHGTFYSPINSCLVALPMIAGEEVITVEGLMSEGKLAEVQQVLSEAGGSQCGYCTPGFAVAMFAEQYRREARPLSEQSLTGNLCRCTGYRPIRDALLSLGPPAAGPHLARLSYPAPVPASFTYHTTEGRFSKPGTLEECCDILDEDPEARLMAGNTDLGVASRHGGACAVHIIATDGISRLREFRDGADAVEIGSAVTLTEIEQRWSEAPTFIREWLQLFASPLVRSRATVVGNLATASPIGDASVLLLSLGAEILVASRKGERTITIDDFFAGYRLSTLARNEVIVSVRIPKPLPTDVRYYKVSKRLYNDISTVSGSFALWRDSSGLIRKALLAFGGVAAKPVRVPAAEAALIGTLGEGQDFAAACGRLSPALAPIDDHRGSAAYRQAMIRNLLLKFESDMLENGIFS